MGGASVHAPAQPTRSLALARDDTQLVGALNESIANAMNVVGIRRLIAAFAHDRGDLAAVIRGVQDHVRQHVAGTTRPPLPLRVRVVDHCVEHRFVQIAVPRIAQRVELRRALIERQLRPHGKTRFIFSKSRDPQPLRADDVREDPHRARRRMNRAEARDLLAIGPVVVGEET